MGGSKNYISSGGFSKQEYKSVGKTKNGIKILEKREGGSSSLPLYSNTPNTVYAIRDSNSKALKQISFYGGKDGRIKIKDLDWSHEHKPYKSIHVHEYDSAGVRKRVRKPSKKEKRIVLMSIGKKV